MTIRKPYIQINLCKKIPKNQIAPKALIEHGSLYGHLCFFFFFVFISLRHHDGNPTQNSSFLFHKKSLLMKLIT